MLSAVNLNISSVVIINFINFIVCIFPEYVYL